MSSKNDDRRNTGAHPVVYTVTANCRDCYRCVRVCPVKAIRVIEGQANIQDELCIQCGTCVKECPQHAKIIRNDIDKIKDLLSSGKKVAISIAPSFAAVFDGWRTYRLPSALRMLGFQYVSETAEGAMLITEESFKSSTGGNICTACPTVVSYLEKYRTDYVEGLIPIVSPMVAHGRLLKKRLGDDWAVVFAGPCAAKKREASLPINADAIDGVLTFQELIDWFRDEGIDLANCSEGGFESYGCLEKARLFPLQGGMLKTGNIEYDGTNEGIIHVSGPDDVMGLFDLPAASWDYRVAEPLFCAGGCINGPGFPPDKNIFTRKQNIISYAEQASNSQTDLDRSVSCTTGFQDESILGKLEEIQEGRIDEILEKTGKSDPKLQLNCGACGYKSCRDNAIAVARGMAEAEMCMPYMRRLAQQRTDRIIETTPNGIVVLDREQKIISMNPAFQKMFMCNNGILGRPISYLLDPDNYEKLVVGSAELCDSIKSKYGIRYHETAYALRSEEQYVGIYSDMTKVTFDDTQVDLIKQQTLEQARELLNHQVSFSQTMAHYLGRSTAQSEELLKRLMNLYEVDEEHGNK